MTSTIRKLRTLREREVSPPGLTDYATRNRGPAKGKGNRDRHPPQIAQTHADAIDFRLDSRAVLSFMGDFERRHAEKLTAGHWSTFGDAVASETQLRLSHGSEYVVGNPLADVDDQAAPHYMAAIVCRRVAVLVYRVEVEPLYRALCKCYREARAATAEQELLFCPVESLGIAAATCRKMAMRGVMEVGDLLEYSIKNLRVSLQLSPEEAASVLDAVRAVGMDLETY